MNNGNLLDRYDRRDTMDTHVDGDGPLNLPRNLRKPPRTPLGCLPRTEANSWPPGKLVVGQRLGRALGARSFITNQQRGNRVVWKNPSFGAESNETGGLERHWCRSTYSRFVRRFVVGAPATLPLGTVRTRKNRGGDDVSAPKLWRERAGPALILRPCWRGWLRKGVFLRPPALVRRWGQSGQTDWSRILRRGL